MRILVVEDSLLLQKSLSLGLRKAGYAVDVAGDGEQGLWLVESNDYDVIILDLMLPKLDGLTILQRLRRKGKNTPVLILTAKDTLEDRVAGLRHGADDYLCKPFELEELLARLESLIRRGQQNKNPILTVGDLSVDTVKRAVRRAGHPIELTNREYRLLEYLVYRRGHVVSRSEIEQHIYDEDADLFSNVVDSAICTLRKKLETRDCVPLIHTRRGMGYVLEAEEA